MSGSSPNCPSTKRASCCGASSASNSLPTDAAIGTAAARRHAAALLRTLDRDETVSETADHPALAWRRAGLAAVTGRPDGPGLVCPVPLTTAADGAMLALRALADDRGALPRIGAALLGERARLLGLARGGATSANGSCRLIACRDGTIALNLARADDWTLLPALFKADVAPDWEAVRAAARDAPVGWLVARGIELGLAIALDAPAGPAAGWAAITPGGQARRATRPCVVDLSSLWAGPLVGSLLALLGADVVKVESRARPDGARRGDATFFALLNAGKRMQAVDFADRAALAAVIGDADIVIAASRPRALRQLGIDPDAFVARGGIWIGITGHGDTGSVADRIGFGDDAAVAAGIAHVMRAGWGAAMFAGDAIADPLTGIHAALAAWALWQHGRGAHVALSLAGTVCHAIGQGAAMRVATGAMLARWQALADGDDHPLYAQRRPC